jgi:endonuclease-3
MIKTSKKNIQEIKEILLEKYKDAKTELKYKNDYELLISIILSAQCTDKRVNIITPALFKKYPSTKELAKANLDDVKEIIKSCSFFNNKAKNIIQMAKMVEEKYNGKIPHEHKELIKLAGVGNKTANVFLIEQDNENRMAVDTHVFRVSHRLGLSDAKNVEGTEKDLIEAFKTDLATLHQALVLFGRYICTAKNPKCDKCFLTKYCQSKEGFKPS